MKILQISNDFFGSKVHANLFKELSKQGIGQTIYCPVRSADDMGKNAFTAEGTNIVYDFVIKPYHRYVYHIKRRTIFRSLQKKVNFEDVDLCHAATLFSDGGQAYLINKKYKIPYIVAVRSTDVNNFLAQAPNTWLAGKKILLNASKIVFVSPALKEKFCKHWFVKSFLSKIEKKIVIMNNGIDDFWIDNVNEENLQYNHQLLYVGTMIRRKNPILLIQTVLDLVAKYPDIKLNIIGSTGEDEEKVLALANQYNNNISYHGQINDKRELLKHYRANTLFVLPSINETFGLVYLEALSQNLPVVYTKGDGIDGLLAEHNGVGITYPTHDNIKEAITKVFSDRNFYSNKGIDFEQFRWKRIVQQYINYYNEINGGNRLS